VHFFSPRFPASPTLKRACRAFSLSSRAHLLQQSAYTIIYNSRAARARGLNGRLAASFCAAGNEREMLCERLLFLQNYHAVLPQRARRDHSAASYSIFSDFSFFNWQFLKSQLCEVFFRLQIFSLLQSLIGFPDVRCADLQF
jgi:hypothetical protein